MASPKGVRKRPFLARAIRRGRRVMDPALSRIELRASGLELHSPTSHEERLVLLPAAPVLRSASTVVYDIGAAAGEYTTAFSKVSTVSQIIAFEPLAESYAALERRARDVSSIRCFRLALGDENGRLDLHRSVLRDTSSLLPISDTMRVHFPLGAEIEGAERVAVARLDDVVAEHGLPTPDLVKMDVQGFEDRVIRGGEATLRAARLSIVEVSFRPFYEGSALFDDVYMLMRDLGFVLVGFEGPLSSPSGELLQADAIFESSALPAPR